ncbi:MAG: hypothetical protein AB8G05_00390 [Oligoflexales bacterium]
MDYSKMTLALVFITLSFLGCSTSIDRTDIASSSIGGQDDSDPIFNIDSNEFDEFDEVGQPEPVMITGASLSCALFKRRFVYKTNLDNEIRVFYNRL